MWVWPVAVPTCTLGACELISVQGAPTSKYKSIQPESAMIDALAETGVVVGNSGSVVMVKGGVGIKSLVVDNDKLFSTTAPNCHSPAYHPRLMFTPVPSGLDIVADPTWLS